MLTNRIRTGISSVEWLKLFGIIGLAIVLRLAWVAIVPVTPVSDSAAYFTFATNIAEGNGYGWTPGQPSTYWAVGPSAYYAFFLLFLGKTAAVVIGNLIVAILGVLLTYSVGYKFFGSFAGLFGAALFAIWPTSIMFTTVLNSEMIFAPLLLASVWLVGPTKRGDRVWIIGGVIFALAAYVRPVALLFPAVLGITKVVSSLRWKTLRHVVLASIVMLACITPWTIRNYHATGHLVVISTNAGTNLWMGNNPESNGTYQQLPETVKGMSEVERDQVLGKYAKEYIRAEPLAFVARTIKKLLLLHRSETIGVAWNAQGMETGPLKMMATPLKLVGTGFWWATIIGTIGCAYFLYKKIGLRRSIFHPVIFMSIYLIGVQSIVVAQDRYHLQWSPLFIVLSGYFISHLLFNRSRSNPEPGI